MTNIKLAKFSVGNNNLKYLKFDTKSTKENRAAIKFFAAFWRTI